MRSTRYILAIGALAAAIAGCTARPETSVNASRNANLNANVNASLDDDTNGNAGRDAADDRDARPPAVIGSPEIPPPDGGPARNPGGDDAAIEAELNALGASDSGAEIGEMEKEINAE